LQITPAGPGLKRKKAAEFSAAFFVANFATDSAALAGGHKGNPA
jgi:hypothetical protein